MKRICKRRASSVEMAREAVRRSKLLHFLDSDEPAWKDRDHPDLARGSATWVRKLRREIERRGGITAHRVL